MKLLLDQNLSHRILPAITSIFPESRHVKDFGMSEADDTAIWNLADREGFAIVSKDSDFLYRSLLAKGHPKVIQLRVGNCSSRQIQELIIREKASIQHFLTDPEETLLILE